MIPKKVYRIFLFFPLTLLFTFTVMAQNKVVVIPLVGGGPSGPPVPVPKTGQTTCYNEAGTVISCTDTGQDGDIQAGEAWPTPRFVESNGTVTDKLTDLIWLKAGNCTTFFSGDVTGQNIRKWEFALDACNALVSGYCGLNDGSGLGDWRLPNRWELDSLIDHGQNNPALPAGCPITLANNFAKYWSSTTYANYYNMAWFVHFGDGYGNGTFKSESNDKYVLCVR